MGWKIGVALGGKRVIFMMIYALTKSTSNSEWSIYLGQEHSMRDFSPADKFLSKEQTSCVSIQ